MHIDLRKDAVELRAFLADALATYAKKHVDPASANAHRPLTKIDFWFWLGDGGSTPLVALNLDTRVGAEPDGEWSHENFATLERPQWKEPLDAVCDGGAVTITLADGTTRPLRAAETDDLFGRFCVEALKSAAADGLFRGPHVASGCELGVECDDGHFGWPHYDDRGLENMADPRENGRRLAPGPPMSDEERASEDPGPYDVWAAIPPGKDRKAAIAALGSALGIGLAGARQMLDSGGMLAELVEGAEVVRLGKLLRGRGLAIRTEPPFRWRIE